MQIIERTKKKDENLMEYYKYIKYKLSGKIAIIKISRPEVLNAIDNDVLDELEDVFTKLEESKNLQIIIITGEGEKSFVAGGNIQEMRDMSLLEGERFVYRGQRLLNQIENSNKIVIAALNGYTLGGGLELALACDIRIASENVLLGLPEVKHGLYPGWGGTQRLVRLVGKGIAKELVFTGKMIDVKIAEKFHLVNKVVSSEELLNECMKLADSILKNSPIAIMQAKKAINHGSEVSLDKGLTLEAEAWLMNFSTNDRIEGLSAFLEKRDPIYTQQ